MSKKPVIVFEGIEGSGKSHHILNVSNFLKKNDIIGKFRVVYDEELMGEYDLLAANDVEKVNIFSRLIMSLNYLIWGDV